MKKYSSDEVAQVLAAGILYMADLLRGKKPVADEADVDVLDDAGGKAPAVQFPTVEEIREMGKDALTELLGKVGVEKFASVKAGRLAASVLGHLVRGEDDVLTQIPMADLKAAALTLGVAKRKSAESQIAELRKSLKLEQFAVGGGETAAADEAGEDAQEPDADGDKIEVGSRVVWNNPEDSADYAGEVTAVDEDNGTVAVKFDDGDKLSFEGDELAQLSLESGGDDEPAADDPEEEEAEQSEEAKKPVRRRSSTSRRRSPR